MNCCYCQYGWTPELVSEAGPDSPLPSLEAVESVVEAVLKNGREFDYLTFSGNGEPTLHPEFSRIVDVILRLRASYRANFKLALLSNATTAHRPGLREALAKIDLPVLKLDAGNARMFRKVNHAAPHVTYDDVLRGIKSLNGVVIQTMFVNGSVDNSSPEQVASWMERIAEIQPRWVQVYSLERGAADHRLRVVEPARLRQIAAQVQTQVGIKVDVY